MSPADFDRMADAIAERLERRLARHPVPEFRSIKEFCFATGIGTRTVRRAIAEGRLDAQRQGHRVLIPVGARIRPVAG